MFEALLASAVIDLIIAGGNCLSEERVSKLITYIIGLLFQMGTVFK
jgi:hypothetical protein